MARPQSQALAGYFPTPSHLLSSFASIFRLEAQEDVYRAQPLFFDPCAGTGEALELLAQSAWNESPESTTSASLLAIELETTRAALLRERFGSNYAHQGDAFAFGFDPHPGATVLYLNPPYDHDREYGRLEHRFLVRFTEALARGGALLFVVPCGSLQASAQFLSEQYQDVNVWRFPAGDFEAFHQCILVARRRETTGLADPAIRELLTAAAADPSHLPSLDAPLAEPRLTICFEYAHLTLQEQRADIPLILANIKPFSRQPQAFGLDRPADELLGTPLPSALPPRPAHIALALSAGLLNGRKLMANDPGRFPPLLAKGTFTKTFTTVDQRRDKDGKVTGLVQVQQPRLDLNILRLDTLTFRQLKLGTEPTDASSIEDFTTADLIENYSRSLSAHLREQIPALHDPANPTHALRLPTLGRRPYKTQAELIQAGLKLLAQGENPQLLAEVGTGKSTIALSIAGALAPEHFPSTVQELHRAGFPTKHLRPVRRILIVCPPHLVQSWRDQAQAVLPAANLRVIRQPSDASAPADVYLLSRETAKLGPKIQGSAATHCPRCAQPLSPLPSETRAARRSTCDSDTPVPAEPLATFTRDLALLLYPWASSSLASRLREILAVYPAAWRRLGARPSPDDRPLPVARLQRFIERALELFPSVVESHPYTAAATTPIYAAACLARLTGTLSETRARAEAFLEDLCTSGSGPAIRCVLNELPALFPEEDSAAPLDPEEQSAIFEDLFKRLLQNSRWEQRTGCGEALHSMSPQPRRYPLARYILRHCRNYFDFLILDEAHEFSTPGSAQEKAAHRLVSLPGVPTIALTGSLMGGYASSLFANAWSLSQAFRDRFDREDKPAFVSRYGYQKILVPVERDGRPTTFGSMSDRADTEQQKIRQLGEAPGILPLYILEHILPVGLIMHKSDLEEELPPCREEPTPITPREDDLQDRRLLNEFKRVRDAVVRQIRADRGTPRAGLLWGAMTQLPSYLDLACEDCGPFLLHYPKEAGGQVVAQGVSFPASWRTPKERWLLDTVRQEISEGRRCLVFLQHTGNTGFIQRLRSLFFEELGEESIFLDPGKVSPAARENWLNNEVIRTGTPILLVHPRAVQTGLNNLTAFHTAIWYEGPDYDARTTRQANGRPHRIGQSQPVRLLYPFYQDTLQETALDLVARKITASLQVDGLSIAGALEAAGATSEEDQLHAAAALALGQALYRSLGE